jgi:SAM-dependent methyltransferase
LIRRYKESSVWKKLYPLRKRLYPVKKGLGGAGRRLYHTTRAKLELLSLRWAFRRKFGGQVVTRVDPRDEMYAFIADHWDWPHHASPMADRAYALRSYLTVGEQNVRELEDALADADRPLPQVRSFLEFACGHGRMTRFLVHRIERSRITVSDINPSAVAFTCATFGVVGFTSVEDPADLRHDRRYEVIFAGSLFTHLSFAHWGAWLQCLYSLLTESGLLIFSTHGPGVLDDIYGDGWKSQTETVEEGFLFIRANETNGRLPASYYGATFVTEKYVRSFVEEHEIGKIRDFRPARYQFQDLYVLERQV